MIPISTVRGAMKASAAKTEKNNASRMTGRARIERESVVTYVLIDPCISNILSPPSQLMSNRASVRSPKSNKLDARFAGPDAAKTLAETLTSVEGSKKLPSSIVLGGIASFRTKTLS